MNELILVMIMVATAAYVAQPFWRKHQTAIRPANSGLRDDLLEKRDSLLAQIKEIEFDHEVGMVSADDFSELNARYRAEVITIMRRIDVLSGSNGSPKKLKKKFAKTQTKGKKNNSVASGFKNKVSCFQCGNSVTSADIFCSKCGQRVKN